jgi:hypothetical protein
MGKKINRIVTISLLQEIAILLYFALSLRISGSCAAPAKSPNPNLEIRIGSMLGIRDHLKTKATMGPNRLSIRSPKGLARKELQ